MCENSQGWFLSSLFRSSWELHYLLYKILPLAAFWFHFVAAFPDTLTWFCSWYMQAAALLWKTNKKIPILDCIRAIILMKIKDKNALWGRGDAASILNQIDLPPWMEDSPPRVEEPGISKGLSVSAWYWGDKWMLWRINPWPIPLERRKQSVFCCMKWLLLVCPCPHAQVFLLETEHLGNPC